MPNATIVLHPKLRRRLALPESVRNVDLHILEHSILEECGLEPANANFLLDQVYGRPRNESRSLLAVYEEHPTTPLSKGNVGKRTCTIGSNGASQRPTPGSPSHISFRICCDLTATRSQALRAFDLLYCQKKREYLIPVPGRHSGKVNFFKRDLFVYALREDRLWSAVDIDLQLEFMGLPKLTDVWMQSSRDKRRVGRTDAKAARRKIVFRTARLIERYYGVAVFVPAHVRAVTDKLEDMGKPTAFLSAMLCATDERRVAAQQQSR